MRVADWKIFTGSLRTDYTLGTDEDPLTRLPPPPPWRRFDGVVEKEREIPENDASLDPAGRGHTFRATPEMVEMVNAALYLRRPLLVTGKAGTGKSSLIYAVAHELKLGRVLRWSITSHSTVQSALYEYDAIGRLHQAQLQETTPDIGDYLKFGPLGTALLPTRRPQALLVDEIDKSDVDLPNDLLNIFEEGEFEISELARLNVGITKIQSYNSNEKFPINGGHVRCHEFPFVILTNNGERDFPPPFLRRCLQLDIPEPDEDLLAAIVEAHLGPVAAAESKALIKEFFNLRKKSVLATDQLLNAIHLVMNGRIELEQREQLIERIVRELAPVSPT